MPFHRRSAGSSRFGRDKYKIFFDSYERNMDEADCMLTENLLTLSDMKAGQKGMVVALNGGYEFQTRLVSMGVHLGCEIEVLHSGNGRGGPRLVAIGDSRLAIGYGMLDRVLVAVDPE